MALAGNFPKENSKEANNPFTMIGPLQGPAAPIPGEMVANPAAAA